MSTIAGIPIPDGRLARDATQLVRDTATELLFHHSRRVFLWGALQAQRTGLAYDAELFYVGAMFHDLGLIEGHRSAAERFEIDGANAARAFLESRAVPEAEVMTVWTAIALHTTPGIPAYLHAEAQLVTLGVEYDVLGFHHDDIAPGLRDEVIGAHPRVDFAEGIVQAFYDGIRDKPQTAFGTMNTDILEAKLPGYVRPNFCDLIADAPFGR